MDGIREQLAADPGLVVFEPATAEAPDVLGRIRYVRHWWGWREDLGAYGHRVQVFVADMQERAAKLREAGVTVRVLPVPGVDW